MKVVVLTDEEQKLLEEVENGEWVPVKDQAKANQEAMEAARNTLNKTRNINIRLSEKDLQKARIKAMGMGIPYQTFISSVIHRFVNE